MISLNQKNNQERRALVEKAWEHPEQLTVISQGDEVWAIRSILADLNEGQLRVAEKVNDSWVTHDWIKKAVLLSFRLNALEMVERPVAGFDKVSSKFADWTLQEYEQAGFRVVPGALVRHSAYIARDVVLMPSFTNVGAYIGKGTMVDIWAQVGSCAQIGERCHLSAGVVIGGVLEPVQANPVIIEDNCFIGTQSAIVEGVIVGEGAVIGMGIMLGASTPIVNRDTGAVNYGQVPPYSVVVPGVMPVKSSNGIQTSCAVIVKTVDEKTRAKTAINELLRS
jgi:2,3,4,5-tetrahydropyridine-2-carboxylate N-succinyltransferase